MVLLHTYCTHPSIYNTYIHRFLQVLHGAVPVTVTIFDGAESITIMDSALDGNAGKYRILKFCT